MGMCHMLCEWKAKIGVWRTALIFSTSFSILSASQNKQWEEEKLSTWDTFLWQNHTVLQSK